MVSARDGSIVCNERVVGCLSLCYVLPSATAAFRSVFLSVLFGVVLHLHVSFLLLMQPPVELVHNGQRWGGHWSIPSGRSPSWPQ